MKQHRKLLPLMILAAVLCTLLCSTAWADDLSSFYIYLDNYDPADQEAAPGAKLYVTPYTDGTARVQIRDIRTDGETLYDLAIPDTVSDKDGNTYTVTAIGENSLSQSLYADQAKKLASLTVGDQVREVQGNFFYWNRCAYEDYPNDQDLYIRRVIPNTANTLQEIPDFISTHYDADGAYYAGKCLVRVDPACSGDLTVKDGTICILASAFEGCNGIRNVTIPDSVEFIGARAFANSSVTAVNLPAGLTEHSSEIPYLCFYGCQELKTITFNQGCLLNKLGYCSFTDCKSLTGFDFTKVKTIDSCAFLGAFNGTSVTLRPEQLMETSIAVFACSGITSLTFTDNLSADGNTILPDSCFACCKSLSAVTLSKDVKKLNAYCFKGCSSLKEDILGKSGCAVEYLDHQCLTACGLTEVTIPKTVTFIAGQVLSSMPSLKTLNWRTEVDCIDFGYYQARLFSIANNGTDITTVNLYCPVKAGGGAFFCELSSLQTVNFLSADADITEIPNHMLFGCPNLSVVTFAKPEVITTIGNEAFQYCNRLTDFPFEKFTGLTRIGSRAFMLESHADAETVAGYTDEKKDFGLKGKLDLNSCTSLTNLGCACFSGQYHITELVLPAGIKTFEEHSQFTYTSSLKTVTMHCPASVIPNIGEVFYAQSNRNVDCPNSVIENFTITDAGPIPSVFFISMHGLKKVRLPEATVLKSYCFLDCTSLEEVYLPSVTEIEDGVFTGCRKLESVSMPSLTKITYTGPFFHGCDALRQVNLGNVTHIPSFMFTGSGITELALHAGVTYDRFAVANCPKLESVVVEEGVTELPEYMFDICPNLKRVSLPSTLTKIYNAAFKECGSSLMLEVPASVTEIHDDAFQNTTVRMLLSGTPSIMAGPPGMTVTTCNSGNPIEAGSTVYCANEDIAALVKMYCDGINMPADERPEIYLVPPLKMSVLSTPEEVKAGEPLDLSALAAQCGDDVLGEEDVTLDYDPTDEEPGERLVSVWANDSYESDVQVRKKTLRAVGFFGRKLSGKWISFSEPQANTETTFTLNVIPPEYTVTGGGGQEWHLESADGPSFTVKRDVSDDKTFGRYKSAKLDGAAIPPESIVTAEGSLVLTIATDFANTLSLGDHVVRILFTDGEAEASFTVLEKIPEPETTPEETSTEAPEETSAEAPPETSTEAPPESSTEAPSEAGTEQPTTQAPEKPAEPKPLSAKLQLDAGMKGSSKGKTVKVKWGSVNGATKYVIYASYCGQLPYKKIAAVKGNVKSLSITKLKGKKLNLKKCVKVYVQAYKGKTKLADSLRIHIACSKNEKSGNSTKVTVPKTSITLKPGKSKKMKAKVELPKGKKKLLGDAHVAALRYATSDKKVAKVDKKGKITAVKPGICYVYAYAVNGYAKRVKVTVE